jgi:hypothetical protein
MKYLFRKPVVSAAGTLTAGLTLYFGLISLLWHKIDHRPPRWDESHYLMISQHAYQALRHFDLLGALSLKTVSDTKSGLVPLLSALTYFVLGESEKRATLLVSVVSLLVIFYALLRLSRLLTDRVGAGAVACLLLCNFPAVIMFSCYYHADLPLVAAVCATVWLCLLIDRAGFQGVRRAALLGATVALGMGIKHLYVAFVALPLALLVGRAVVRSVRPLRVSLRGRWPLFACLGCGVLLGVLYHALNFHVIQEQWRRARDYHLMGVAGTPPSVWAVVVQLFLPFHLPMAAWFLAIGLGLAVLAWQKKWQVVYVLLALAGGYAGLVRTASFPLAYYALPLLPLVCLLVCCPLAVPLPAWRPGRYLEAGRLAVLVVLAALLMRHHSKLMLGTNNLFRVAYKFPGILWTPSRLITANPLARHDYWTHVTVDGNCFPRPLPHYWPMREMLAEAAAAVDRHDPGHSRQYLIGFVTGYHEYMSRELAYLKLRQMRRLGGLELVTPTCPASAGSPLPRSLLDHDFFLLKTGLVYKVAFKGIPEVEALQAFVNSLTTDDYRRLRALRFTLLKRYELPDGSEGTVWQSPRVARPRVSPLATTVKEDR